MRRLLAALALVSALGCLAIARGDDLPLELDGAAIEAIPQVALEGRVRPEWLDDRADRLPLPAARWRSKLPRECRTVGGYRTHCGGPRRVPTPTGAAATLAARLSLTHRGAPLQLLHAAPLDEWIAAAQGIDSREALTFPVPSGHLGRGFGFTREGDLARRRHNGVDIGAEEGSPIVAARGGLVAYSDTFLVGYGNAIIIVHEDGTSAFYAHCRETFVAVGERVRRGERIAEVGDTGFANAPHLHFEFRIRGWPRDPAARFEPR